MEKLLKLAKEHADSAEVYYASSESNSLQFENSSLTDIKNSISSGYALRIFKNGYVGSSYTKNLLNRQSLVENALNSLKGKVLGGFSLPEHHKPKNFNTYSVDYESLTSESVITELKRINSILNKKTTGQINSMSSFGKNKIRIINTNNLDVDNLTSYYYSHPYITFPNSYASVKELVYSTSFCEVSEEKLNEMADLYNKSLNFVKVQSGKIPVIFDSSTFFSIAWRIESALNGKSLYEGISPVKDKLDAKVFSDKLTLTNDPELQNMPYSRSFDDEGVPSHKFTLIEKGVIKNFYNSLEYAKKLNTKPTGHGFRSTRWGGERITIKPSPNLPNLTVLAGDQSLKDMINKTDRGILLLGCLGAHSGNIPNGDFSIGLNPGLYIENGKIIGRIADGMIAGNIYDLLNNIKYIENKVHITNGGRFPAICFDDVNFSVK